MLVLSMEDINIDADSILILLPDLMKSVFYESRFANFPGRNKCCITPVFKISPLAFYFWCHAISVILLA